VIGRGALQRVDDSKEALTGAQLTWGLHPTQPAALAFTNRALWLSRPISLYCFPRQALTLCPQLCVGISPRQYTDVGLLDDPTTRRRRVCFKGYPVACSGQSGIPP
jgi:hypothetical protein